VIDYGSGNLRSAAKALERAAHESGLAADIQVSADPARVAVADRIVLPGVGAFADCLAGLRAIDGLLAALEDTARRRARPFLGICVGMQLLAQHGLEHGRHRGLGWIEGTVKRLCPSDPALKVPHMGWNTLELTEKGAAHPLFAGLAASVHMYFVHSFALTENQGDVLATTEHGGRHIAAVGRENLVGVQFHPEKSQGAGLRFLTNFLMWQPS
jgi:glutamine amidotransferase